MARIRTRAVVGSAHPLHTAFVPPMLGHTWAVMVRINGKALLLSHCGYQQWHRDVDNEVVEWLKSQKRATPRQFEEKLREIYDRPEMRARFPNGY
ncbi:hypothetical protein [Archangium lansingense]|uniref:Uncharacterized protein n=1 Tax=Archangium lansingense TaxID=2995310 RepID=A0ABT4AGG5_9BACT|nr:hypothetical protein [Archangium lansinium]MCY1079957.1 hypothetical protein [Archangium lansinium]